MKKKEKKRERERERIGGEGQPLEASAIFHFRVAMVTAEVEPTQWGKGVTGLKSAAVIITRQTHLVFSPTPHCPSVRKGQSAQTKRQMKEGERERKRERA